jgi:hypothetical protein
MADPVFPGLSSARRSARGALPPAPSGSANLADILERVLDKGVVIAGDIRVNLLDVELLTIRLRLVVASVDRAKEMGIDWWEADPSLSTRASDTDRLAQENRELRERLERLERALELPSNGQQEASRVPQ